MVQSLPAAMKPLIFSGPSLPPSVIRDSHVEWRPPLRQGDLRRAVLERPTAVGLIDGFFETTPTVWHEEILCALDCNIPVYGSSSIGALRAAEMLPFGMFGIGRIFEWFRDGTIQDDDEVALLHAPAELDYAPLTEAMVNVRATAERAVRQNEWDAGTGELIVAAAKSLFYKERTWEAVFERALDFGLSADRTRSARASLPAFQVDVKRMDALDLLALLQRLGA
jgi:hypothetical protein